MWNQKLVKGVFVDLVVLDETVNAEGRDDAHGGYHDNLDNFAHKSLLVLFLFLKYLFLGKKQ
jgi:hypothetical protein